MNRWQAIKALPSMQPRKEQIGECTLYLGDCREILPSLGKVDAVVTDPPYGINYESARTTRLNGMPREHDESFGVDEFDDSWVALAWKCLRNDSLLYCFTRWDVCGQWQSSLTAIGFVIVQRLIWDKCHWKMGDLRYYGSQTEDVLVCRKGNKPIFPEGKGRHGNIFRYSSGFLPEGQENHPTQKPVELVKRFIQDATDADTQTILDPFMGSGTTGVACARLGRKFIGIEIEPKYFDIACRRISQTYEDQRLFANLPPEPTYTQADMFAEVA